MNKSNSCFNRFVVSDEHLDTTEWSQKMKNLNIEQLWTCSSKPNIVEQTFDGKFKVCSLCNQEELELSLVMVEAVEANFRSWTQKDPSPAVETGGQRSTGTISVNIENGPWNEENRGTIEGRDGNQSGYTSIVVAKGSSGCRDR